MPPSELGARGSVAGACERYAPLGGGAGGERAGGYAPRVGVGRAWLVPSAVAGTRLGEGSAWREESRRAGTRPRGRLGGGGGGMGARRQARAPGEGGVKVGRGVGVGVWRERAVGTRSGAPRRGCH